MSIRNEKKSQVILELASKFLELESNRSSLLTVTSVHISDDSKYATVYFTVFPNTYEKTALEFAKRKRSEFKAYLKDHSRIGMIPQIDFEIDLGEKNRQKIDSLLNEG